MDTQKVFHRFLTPATLLSSGIFTAGWLLGSAFAQTPFAKATFATGLILIVLSNTLKIVRGIPLYHALQPSTSLVAYLGGGLALGARRTSLLFGLLIVEVGLFLAALIPNPQTPQATARNLYPGLSPGTHHQPPKGDGKTL